MLPFSIIIGGAIMIALLLNFSFLRVFFQSFLAIVILILFGFFINLGINEIIFNALLTWVPAIILSIIFLKNYSITLTIQILSIITILLLAFFYFYTSDPNYFWSRTLTEFSDILWSSGFEEQANSIQSQINIIAEQMTIIIAISLWSLYSFVLLLGSAIYKSSLKKELNSGSFVDLNLGRSLAIFAAISSLCLFIFEVEWLKNIAYLSFMFFWLQGLAIFHWLYINGLLPKFGLIALYVIMPFFNILLVMLLAVLGYTDAWFNLRSKIKPTKSQ
ncbi:MAG TPA: hypothetical protein QGF04_02770 [Woeseiaceae bacterium]|nr:hypothetical protein [Woeseiaceae bacterium]